MKTNWNLKVTEELNDRTFEAAHDLEVSKSEFIRQAVEEKIGNPEKKPQIVKAELVKDLSADNSKRVTFKNSSYSQNEKRPQKLIKEEKRLSKKLLGAEISQEYVDGVTTEMRREDSPFNPQPKKGKK